MPEEKPKVVARLSSEQINRLDELRAFDESNKRALNVALNFYANRSETSMLDWKKFWDDLESAHEEMDTYDMIYKIERVDGWVCIVEEKEKPLGAI